MLFLSVLPAGAAESEGLPDSMSFQEVLGITSPDLVEKAVLVYEDGKSIELSAEELASLLEVHWNFTMDRVTSPAQETGSSSYINLYTAEGKHTIETWSSRVCVGSYGDIHVYYAPYYGNARNALYTHNSALYEKYRLQAAFPAQPETLYFPVKSWLQLPLDEWAVAEARRAADLNLLPYEWTARYREPITREEFCILVGRMMGLTESGQIASHPSFAAQDLYQLRMKKVGQSGNGANYVEFKDITIYGEIVDLVALSVVSGRDDGSFDPDGTLTRQEAAKILANAAKWFVGIKTNGVSFADDAKIAPWAREQVSFLAENGVMGGVGDNHFDPWSTLSVQQALAAVVRLYELCEANDPDNP